MPHGDDDDSHDRIFNTAHDPIVPHPVTPKTMLRSTEWFAELARIARPQDSFVQKSPNFAGTDRPAVRRSRTAPGSILYSHFTPGVVAAEQLGFAGLQKAEPLLRHADIRRVFLGRDSCEMPSCDGDKFRSQHFLRRADHLGFAQSRIEDKFLRSHSAPSRGGSDPALGRSRNTNGSGMHQTHALQL